MGDKVQNSVTRVTPASFEPSLDYCVTKFPRWDFDKFHLIKPQLGSGMQSVGEVMSIARSWEEGIQKAMRMVTDNKVEGFGPGPFGDSDANIEKALREATHRRIWAIARALEMGYTVQKLHEIIEAARIQRQGHRSGCWWSWRVGRSKSAQRH